MKQPKKSMKKMAGGGMTAGAGSGVGRMQKARMAGGMKDGGKVKSKRGYGGAKKGK